MKYKTLAIPIRRVDFSDSSQILSLFTRDRGRVDGIAKGAYRPGNSFQGPFDLLTLSEVVLVSRRSQSLAILSEATQIDGFRGLRRSWQSYAAAAHVLEFLRVLEIANDPMPALFDLTVEALLLLSHAAFAERIDLSIVDLVSAFELRAFRLLGMSTSIESCADCRRPWRHVERPVFFSFEDVSVLCDPCRQKRRRVRGRVYAGPVVQRLNTLVASDSHSGGAPGNGGRQQVPGVVVTERMPAHAAARFTLPPGEPTEPDLQGELQVLLGQLREFLLERRFSMVKYLADFV